MLYSWIKLLSFFCDRYTASICNREIQLFHIKVFSKVVHRAVTSPSESIDRLVSIPYSYNSPAFLTQSFYELMLNPIKVLRFIYEHHIISRELHVLKNRLS